MRCERAVERAYVNKDYSVVGRRVETPFGELDLLVLSPSGVWVAVEVKTCSRAEMIGHRVSPKQICRLRRIHQWLIYKNPRTRFFVAFVNPKNKIKLLELSDF